MIHVCFGLHDKTGRYSKFTGTTMLSIFENIIAPPHSITVHILHDNTLTPDNHDKFIYVAGRYNQLVKFYNVEELCADKIIGMIGLVPDVEKSRVSVGGFYKLMIPQVIPAEISRCVYLDSDIIVNLDINELWQINLGDKILGVVSEKMMGEEFLQSKMLCIKGYVKFEDYFNAGVLLMNLELLRGEEENIMRGVKFRGEHPETIQFDQTVFNYCFSAQTLKLPLRFNRMTYIRREQETVVGKKIYHYATEYGLGLKQNDVLNRLWLKYFVKTPWFDEETIGRLYEGFEQMYNGLKNSVINISAMMSGKTRAFFTTPENVEATKGIFSIRDDEEIIPAKNQESLQKLIKAMKRSKGKKLFFILLPYFPFDALIQEGFVYGRDFLNGLEFLSAEHGVPLNSYPLVKAM